MVVTEMDTLKRVSDKGLGMAKYVFKTKKRIIWSQSYTGNPILKISIISHLQGIVTKEELGFVEIDVYDVMFTNLSEP